MKFFYIHIVVIVLIVVACVAILLTYNRQHTIDLNYNVKLADYNDKITVDYELTVDGNILDTSFDKNNPLTFVIGEGKVIKGFEKGVLGTTEGQEKIFIVNPEEGYGIVDDYPYKFQEDLNKVLVAVKEQTGKDVNAKDIQGGVFYNMYGQKCIFQSYDINKNIQNINCQHRLAGKTLQFKVKVLKIEKLGEYGTEPEDKNK
ncbi:MAG: hypothetical protein COT14_01505 [Candidatus Diapherotrites archaeon CG08_land_8_20_14_0_20_30_16]|nr:MAG: hypothetical protein COT14_01505 [Candidatus Diapherotrites archaeon CG08_land_8_20_14_0_20_30_16]